MKIKIATYLGFLMYLLLVATVSVLVDLDLWATISLLFVVPSGWLLWRVRPPLSLFLPVFISALATTLLFESIAYSSGLWYELSAFETRVFGIFPLEIIFWNMALQFLVVGVHEYFIDDRNINAIKINWKNLWLLGFLILLATVGVIFATVLSKTVIPFATWWALGGAVLSLGGAMILSHSASRKVLKKAFLTTLLIIPIILIHEAVSLLSFHWVFANTAQYLSSVTVSGELFPLERLLFLIIIPIWLVIIYECYLDDSE